MDYQIIILLCLGLTQTGGPIFNPFRPRDDFKSCVVKFTACIQSDPKKNFSQSLDSCLKEYKL